MRTDVDRAMRRARSYWYEDGLTEIGGGCIFVLIGLLFLVEAITPPSLLPTSFSAIGLPIVVIAASLAAWRLVAAAKARLTYPRTGYVAYRRPATRRRVATASAAALIGALMGVLMAALYMSAPASLAWLLALQGLIIGAFWLYLGHRMGLARFYALAVFSALIGVVASLGGLGHILGDTFYFGALGIAMILSGAITLLIYLRRNQPPAEA